MARRYTQIAFTPTVKEVQVERGSRATYGRIETAEPLPPDALGAHEAEFLAARDSFYMATIGADGWPYVQHRGGPAGFVRVLDPHTLSFDDFAGNRQYLTVGNLRGDDRVSLIFVDYPHRRRLKILGRAEVVPAAPDAETDDGTPVERTMIVRVEGFDWNCPKHITPRYTLAELQQMSEA